MAIPAGWDALGFTSGRRTYRGNKMVGGVAHSNHLDGTAADFTAPLSVLQARFPGHPILNEGDHRHVSGLSDVPYYGNQGIAGLVNGVDTTAPKGNTMLQPRKPNYAGMSQPMGGMDPLAPTAPPPQTPQDAYQQMIGGAGGPMTAQPNFAAMSQPQGGVDPLAPHKKRSILPLILGMIGDGLSAYGGRQGVFAPMMMDQMNQDREDNRFQEHLAATTAAQRETALIKASMPRQPTQTDRYIEEVMNPNTPLDRRKLLMQILTRPLAVMGADGSQTSQYGIPDQSGDDEWEYNN